MKVKIKTNQLELQTKNSLKSVFSPLNKQYNMLNADMWMHIESFLQARDATALSWTTKAIHDHTKLTLQTKYEEHFGKIPPRIIRKIVLSTS